MRVRMYFTALLLFGAVAVFYWIFDGPRSQQSESRSARVAYVVDGDTLALEGIEPRIRLWGVDAPERGELGAGAATNALRQLSDNQLVSYIEKDRDRYGRIVARIFLSDGREVNRLLIEQGVTQEYCRYSQGFYEHCAD